MLIEARPWSGSLPDAQGAFPPVLIQAPQGAFFLPTEKGIFHVSDMFQELMKNRLTCHNEGALYTPPPIPTRLLLDSQNPTGPD